MVRTQVQLTENQVAMIKEISRAGNESIAAVIRRAVDQFLLTQQPDRRAVYRQAADVVGKYRAGVNDLSINHDDYLDEDLSS